jgi:preprotein translocase subunit SecD
MERSWWWKAALFGAAIVLAVLYLVPTVVPEENRPAFFQKYFKKRIQLGLDLKGGLHLVYEVNIEKAVSGKVDRLANDLEDAQKRRAQISRLCDRVETTSPSPSRCRVKLPNSTTSYSSLTAAIWTSSAEMQPVAR